MNSSAEASVRAGGWHRAGQLPDGPVSLVLVALSRDGSVMGAAPMPVPMPWLWRAGQLCLAYTGLRITVTGAGQLDRGQICAVSPRGRTYYPLWNLALGTGERLRPGDFITIGEGMIEISPGPVRGISRSEISAG